jgi:glutamate racemase
MIGVFDSGIGGLTVLAALRHALPSQDLLYLGDTARVPYGTRSPETVVRYSMRVGGYLASEGIEALVVACNTATTHALPSLATACARRGIRVFGVVEPGVREALALHEGGPLAVLGTEGTIAGGAYQDLIHARSPETHVIARACPLFVPLVEEGWCSGDVPARVAECYVGDLRGKVQTAILGCTHYPLLREVLTTTLPGVTLIDSAQATAGFVAQQLEQGTLSSGQGRTEYRVTDHLERFQRVGEAFLGYLPEPTRWIDLPEAPHDFLDR